LSGTLQLRGETIAGKTRHLSYGFRAIGESIPAANAAIPG
jgi:hypothetical protein